MSEIITRHFTPLDLELLMATLLDTRTDLLDTIEDLRRRRAARLAYDPNAASPFTMELISELERNEDHLQRIDALIARLHRGY